MGRRKPGKRKAVQTDVKPPKRLKIDLEAIIKKVAGNDLTKLMHLELIKNCLASIDHTPDHPVYSVMIQEAIKELNEEGGSTKEAISQFILKKYDVLPVFHPAKLNEQLEKLVVKEELALSSENHYVLPVDYDDRPLAEFIAQEKRLRLREQNLRTDKLNEIKGGDQAQEHQNVIIEVEEPSNIATAGCENKLNEPPEFQVTGLKDQNHLLEEQIEVSVDEMVEIPQANGGCPKVVEEDASEKNVEGDNSQIFVGKIQGLTKENEMTEDEIHVQEQEMEAVEDQMELECQIIETALPSYEQSVDAKVHCLSPLINVNAETQIIDFENENHLQDEQIKISEKQGLDSKGKGRQPEVVQEESLNQHPKGVNNQSCRKEILSDINGTEVIEELSEIEAEDKATEDETEAECQVKEKSKLHGTMQAQEVEVLEDQMEAEHQIEEETPQSTTEGQGVAATENEMEVVVTTKCSSHAIQKLHNNGFLVPLLPLKEKFTNFWKKEKEFEQELGEFVNCLSEFHKSSQSSQNVPTLPESEQKTVVQLVNTLKRTMNHLQNQKVEFSRLKRTAEIEIMALEEAFQKQQKKAKLSSPEKEPISQLQFGTSNDLNEKEKQLKILNKEEHLEVELRAENELSQEESNQTTHYDGYKLEEERPFTLSVELSIESPIKEIAKQQRPQYVDELSQPGEHAVNHCVENQQGSQLAMATSNEIQNLENPSELKTATTADLVQTVQIQPSQQQLQLQIQGLPQPEQNLNKIGAGLLPLSKQDEQQDQSQLQDQVRSPRRRRPPKLKQRANVPQGKISKKEPPSDHQNHVEQQQKKLGRGRPRKLKI